MTIDEFKTLDIGDVVELKSYYYELVDISFNGSARNFSFECNKNRMFIVQEINNNYFVTFLINGHSSFCNISQEHGFNIKKIPNEQADMIKRNIKEKRQIILTETIVEKETELTNLKKELDELKRKNMLAQIIPGNVYRFNYNGYNAVEYINHINNINIYTTCLSSMEPEDYNIENCSDFILLKDVTEAYKNFKTLLETA